MPRMQLASGMYRSTKTEQTQRLTILFFHLFLSFEFCFRLFTGRSNTLMSSHIFLLSSSPNCSVLNFIEYDSPPCLNVNLYFALVSLVGDHPHQCPVHLLPPASDYTGLYWRPGLSLIQPPIAFLKPQVESQTHTHRGKLIHFHRGP